MASSSSRVQAVVRNSSVSASTEELVKMRASRAHPPRFGFIGDPRSSPASHQSLMALKRCLDLENWIPGMAGHRSQTDAV